MGELETAAAVRDGRQSDCRRVFSKSDLIRVKGKILTNEKTLENHDTIVFHVQPSIPLSKVINLL